MIDRGIKTRASIIAFAGHRGAQRVFDLFGKLVERRQGRARTGIGDDVQRAQGNAKREQLPGDVNVRFIHGWPILSVVSPSSTVAEAGGEAIAPGGGAAR